MTDDTERLEDHAHRLMTRLEVLRHKDGHWMVPERFDQLVTCLYGALRQQIRLAREIDEMRERGKIDVDVLVDVKSESATEQL